MQLTQWTIFIDMLGFREINGSIDSEAKAKELIEFMDVNREIINLTDSDYIKKKYSEDENFDLYKYYDIQYAFVSDSLIITYYPKNVEDLVNIDLANTHSANALFIISMRLMTFFYHCFSQKGLFLRGGISNKYCYIKENFAVGEGLIEAYEAERTFAKNPRLILHPEVQKNTKLMERINFLSDVMYSGKAILKKDEDELYFIDYIGYVISCTDLTIPMIRRSACSNPSLYKFNCERAENYVREHSEAISKNLRQLREAQKVFEPGSSEANKIETVISKYIWLQNYHNTKIAGHKILSKYVCN